MDLSLPLLLFLPDTARIMIGVALMLGAIVTALFYMVAYALQHPPLLTLAKEELAALIFSVVIIVFWLASSSVLDPLARGLISPIGATPPDHPASELFSSHVTLAIASTDILFAKLRELYTSMYLYEALIGFLSTMSFPIGSPIAGPAIISFSLMPFDGLNLLSNAHTIVVESIGTMMTFIWAKQFILIFCRDALPVIFLPLGLVFRAIPFLRTTGSSIIALCFAGYFVLPFAVLFSNFVIFDVYKPVDFVYAPEHIGPYKSDVSESRVTDEISGAEGARTKAEEVRKLFTSQSSANAAATTQACSGNAIAQMFCSAGNVITGIGRGIADFASTVWNIWKFMMGMTGDFGSFFFSGANQLLPSSATAGMYFFIIDSVVAHAQFLVLVIITTVIELIFTVTMYRNIAMVIGGELEIAGLSKII